MISRPLPKAGLLTAALILCATMLAGQPARACSDTEFCRVDGGEYLLRTPAGWDGRSPLPTVVFLHGFRGSAEEVMADAALGRELSDVGALLVAPQGRAPPGSGRGWSFPGKDNGPRDDIAFIEAVVADVFAHYPIDRRRLIASGFSIGGSMVWYLACQGRGLFAAYAPIAGAFWVPEPATCPAGPQAIRHIHGLADRTVPMEGRTVGGRFRQGNVRSGIETWRKTNGCTGEPVASQNEGLACSTWPTENCSGGREVVLCLHGGEHEIEARWVADGVRWAGQLPPRGAVSSGQK